MSKVLLGVIGALLALGLSAGAQEQSLAEAARKARERKKDAPKATKVFTNDNLPKAGSEISVVGSSAVPTTEKTAGVAPTEEGAPKDLSRDEGYWRGRFAELRTKIQQAEKEVDILQRELNLMQQQYYPDPNKTLREEYERKAINDHRKKIEDKQTELQQLRQQLADLEDELRRAGAPAGWARQ